MELRQLRHFVVLAEEMHFGRAAKRLFMTQPALSTSLMRLEEDAQVRLFERDSQAMQITLSGKAMLDRAKEIVSLAAKLEEMGHAMASGRAGFLEVGFTGTMLFRGLTHVLSKFSNNFPEIDLVLREFSTQTQTDMLRAGRLDAAFINSPLPPAGLANVVLFEERFVACLPEQHPLAGTAVLNVEELHNEVVIILSRDISPAYYDHVVAICATGGFQPKIRVAASQVLTIVALVASGIGVSIVPESVSKAGVAGVRYVPLRGVVRQPSAYLAWNPERVVPGLQSLIDTVEQVQTAGI